MLIGGNAYAQTQLPKCVLFGFGNCIGTLSFSNGDIYTGEFNYGKPNGKGAFTYGNGDSYSGAVVEGQRHGSGTYTSAAGASAKNQPPTKGSILIWGNFCGNFLRFLSFSLTNT